MGGGPVPTDDDKEGVPTEPEETLCCEAIIASCLSCAEGLTVDEYCKSNPDVAGCESHSRQQAAGSASAQADGTAGRLTSEAMPPSLPRPQPPQPPQLSQPPPQQPDMQGGQANLSRRQHTDNNNNNNDNNNNNNNNNNDDDEVDELKLQLDDEGNPEINLYSRRSTCPKCGYHKPANANVCMVCGYKRTYLNRPYLNGINPVILETILVSIYAMVTIPLNLVTLLRVWSNGFYPEQRYPGTCADRSWQRAQQQQHTGKAAD